MVENSSNIREVTGSSPVLPTTTPVSAQNKLAEPSILELLGILLGSDLRRRYNLRQMPNEEIFNKYYIQLRLRVQNEHNYQSYIYLLEKFRGFLGDRKPVPDLAREFVAGYFLSHSENVTEYRL